MEKPRPWIGRFHSTERCCDESRRMADTITLHAMAGSAGRFCVVRLIDGSSDGVAYDTRVDAERRKTHPAQVGLVIPPGGMTAPEAEEVLHYHRELYDKLGGRPFEVGYLMPLTRADQRRQIRILQKG